MVGSFDLEADSLDGPPPPTPGRVRGSSGVAPAKKPLRSEEAGLRSTLALVSSPSPLVVCVACGRGPMDTEWHSKKLRKKHGEVVSTEYVGRWCAGCLLTAKRAYPFVDPYAGMIDNLADPRYKASFAKADRVRRGDEKPDFVPMRVVSKVRVGYKVDKDLELFDGSQFRARFKSSPLEVQAPIETFVMPSGAEVSGVAVSVPGPLRLTTHVTHDCDLHSMHLASAAHIRREQGLEVHDFLTKRLAASMPTRMSHMEVEAAVEAMSEQQTQATVSRPSNSKAGSSDDNDGMEQELVEGKQDAPALHASGGGSWADKSGGRPKAIGRRRRLTPRRCLTPRRTPADGDGAVASLIDALDGRTSGQERIGNASLAELWIRKLDVMAIMNGVEMSGVTLKGARQARDCMVEHGQVGEAAKLRHHLKLTAAACELQRFKTMRSGELLETIDVLEQGGFQVPCVIGLDILMSASRPLSGSRVPDAAVVLNMLWMWPLNPSAPCCDFRARNPKLCDLAASMLEKAAAFKACYVESYLGALLAMGPCREIETAARLFLERWEARQVDDEEVHLFCPGQNAATAVAPLA